ncbi:hypothetical protein [Rubrivirga sp.]|uniref:hypothetical protein n=1 Tax=Rubrivirga sp. TaxID=1885344 RepID=UPI003B52D326
MQLETEAGGVVRFPSPKEAAKAARGIGGANGDFAILVIGDAFVQAARAPSGEYVLEYREGPAGPHHQALSISADVIADAFERFAAGDETRNPNVRWSLLETRAVSNIMSGGQRLPEGFYEIAPRLRRGDRPLDIRNDIMEATGLSKLAAAKRVEEVEKLIKAAKAAVGGALLSFIVVAFFHESILHWAIFGLGGLAQLGFAWYIFRESRPARQAV